VPWLGRDFFPDTDSGQFRLHVRAKAGTRIEETARVCDLVESSIRHHIPGAELDSVLDNIGLPYSGINTAYSNSGVIGSEDADILVSLKQEHHPTNDYVRKLRHDLASEYPGITFYFLPADMVTQILNFGLPAPIDVQVQCRRVSRWPINSSTSSDRFQDWVICGFSSRPISPSCT
jgi:multidrug efflux pump subunit AcrB